MADKHVAPSSPESRTQIMPTIDTPTLVSIIQDIQGRDPNRWAEFYAIYKPMLMGYFRRQGLSESDAQDLCQDVFLKLFRRIRDYNRERTRFRTWLFTVARNTLIDRARREQTRRQAVDGWVDRVLREAKGDEDRQRREFEKSHHARILQYAFEEVRRRSKERPWKCFEMSVIQGMSGADVAAALGVSANLVYVNSCRVLRRVKDLCRFYDEDLKHEPDERVP